MASKLILAKCCRATRSVCGHWLLRHPSLAHTCPATAPPSQVYTSVSKGQVASSRDLEDAFGSDHVMNACRIILARGELQVGPP